VGYHLSLARTQDPGLQSEHETAARKPARLTAHGAERIQQLVAFVQATGGYPSRSSDDISERTLAEWLQPPRREVADGMLGPVYREALGVLPGWRDTRRAVADEARWQELLAALVAYRASSQDRPRHKATVTSIERSSALRAEICDWRRRQSATGTIQESDPSNAPNGMSGRSRSTDGLEL
jgi:hypothetical protein